MRATTAGKKAQTGERPEPVGKRIGQTLLEPTDRAGANAREHNAWFPGFANNLRDTPIAPYGKKTLRVAAADINDVLREQKRAQIGSALKQRQYRWTATELQKRRIKARDVMIRFAARRGHERNARIFHAALAEDVLLQLKILGVAIKSPAADRDNLLCLGYHRVLVHGADDPRT